MRWTRNSPRPGARPNWPGNSRRGASGPPARQSWPRPGNPKPIVIIGAGGIVTDAHLPAYRLANLPVAGVFDLDADRARAVAEAWDTRAFGSLDEAIATPDAVYDLALPPAAHLDVLPSSGRHLLERLRRRLVGELPEARQRQLDRDGQRLAHPGVGCVERRTQCGEPHGCSATVILSTLDHQRRWRIA